MTSWTKILDHVIFPCPSLFVSMTQFKHPATHFWESIHQLGSQWSGVFVLSPSAVRNYWMSPTEFRNMNKHNSPQRWAPSGSCRCGRDRSRPVWSVRRWWPGCSGASGHGEPRGASAGSPAPGAAGTSYPGRQQTREDIKGEGRVFVNMTGTQFIESGWNDENQSVGIQLRRSLSNSTHQMAQVWQYFSYAALSIWTWPD